MSQPPPPIDPLIRIRSVSGQTPPPPPPAPRPPSVSRPLPPTGAAVPARPHVAAAPVGAASHSARSTTPSRRTPPARKSKIASLALSVAATVGLTAAFARGGADGGAVADAVDTGGAGDGNVGGAIGAGATPTGGGATGAVGAPVTTTPAADQVTPTVAIADGTYTGDTFTNRWGPVQVQVVYAGGSITDVVVLRYPDGDRKSVSINQRALPRLEASAIAVQSAAVSRVSGATYTWRSYRQSLQSAIDAAVSASGSVG